MSANTFPEFGIVVIKRGVRRSCPGSGLEVGKRAFVRCDRCGRKLRPTTFKRLPTHKKRVVQQ